MDPLNVSRVATPVDPQYPPPAIYGTDAMQAAARDALPQHLPPHARAMLNRLSDAAAGRLAPGPVNLLANTDSLASARTGTQAPDGNGGRSQDRGLVHLLRGLLPIVTQMIEHPTSTRNLSHPWWNRAAEDGEDEGGDDRSDRRHRQESGVAGGQYDAFILESAERHGVDPSLVEAVIRQSSQGDTNAVAPNGAAGLMLIEPTAASQLAGRVVGTNELKADPRLNIDLGTKYLSWLLQRKSTLEDALGAWHQGPYVDWRAIPQARSFVSAVMAGLRQDTWPIR